MGLKTGKSIADKILIIVNSLLVALLVFRSFLTINTIDEVFNIEEAFRTIQGNKFLVENWDYYQTGDIFIYPFLKAFYLVTGSTEGIVLYTRIVFVFLQIIFVFVMYRLLSKFFDRRALLLSLLFFASLVSCMIFNMWYDTWECYFRLIGVALILYALGNEENTSKKRSAVCFIAAGALHALMVFSYPTMIVSYLFVFVSLLVMKKWKFGLYYVLGAGLVFLLFVIYAMTVGVRNIFVFNSVISEIGTASVGRADMFSLSRIVKLAKEFFVLNFERYMIALVIFALDVVIFFVVRKHEKYKIVFCVVMVIGCLIHMLESIFDAGTTNTMPTYLSLYTPFLYFLNGKKHKLTMLYIFGLSYVAGFVYTYTALYGAVKFSAGAKSAAILTVILLFEVLGKCSKEAKIKGGTIASILATSLIFIITFAMCISASYGTEFKATKPLDCKYLIREGIFKGILEDKERAEKYIELERGLRASVKEGDETITCGYYSILCYLMTDLKPDTDNLWVSDDYTLLRAYFDNNYGNPDIIVLNGDYDEYTDPRFMEFILDNYDLADEAGGFLIYHIRLS